MSDQPKPLPTRVVVNAIDIIGPPMANIQHDLGPDEVLCPTCHGVGLYKTEDVGPERVWRDGQWVSQVPWRNQYLVVCQQCYDGKATLCRHCQKPMPRSALCQCAGAEAHRTEVEQAAEAKRQSTCAHVALDDYAYDHVYAFNNDAYILTDDIEDYLAEALDPATEVFFACTAAEIDCKQRAASVINDMQAAVTDACDDVELEYTESAAAAETALAEVLDAWADEHVKIPVLYWRNLNLIVDVPQAWREASDDDEEEAPDAEEALNEL